MHSPLFIVAVALLVVAILEAVNATTPPGSPQKHDAKPKTKTTPPTKPGAKDHPKPAGAHDKPGQANPAGAHDKPGHASPAGAHDKPGHANQAAAHDKTGAAKDHAKPAGAHDKTGAAKDHAKPAGAHDKPVHANPAAAHDKTGAAKDHAKPGHAAPDAKNHAEPAAGHANPAAGHANPANAHGKEHVDKNVAGAVHAPQVPAEAADMHTVSKLAAVPAIRANRAELDNDEATMLDSASREAASINFADDENSPSLLSGDVAAPVADEDDDDDDDSLDDELADFDEEGGRPAAGGNMDIEAKKGFELDDSAALEEEDEPLRGKAIGAGGLEDMEMNNKSVMV